MMSIIEYIYFKLFYVVKAAIINVLKYALKMFNFTKKIDYLWQKIQYKKLKKIIYVSKLCLFTSVSHRRLMQSNRLRKKRNPSANVSK